MIDISIMFSGIIEAQTQILSCSQTNNSETIVFQNTSEFCNTFYDIKNLSLDMALRILVIKPKEFNDLKIGDSIACNGVCLTVENFNQESIEFCLGVETLKIISSGLVSWFNKPINLERSLVFGARVHGHLVTGHVDSITKVLKSYKDGECWQLQIEIPNYLQGFFWQKGSVCLNGVSLTVNQVSETHWLEVCLIPETIQKTNLVFYKTGDFINIESDYLAKAYFNNQKLNQVMKVEQNT